MADDIKQLEHGRDELIEELQRVRESERVLRQILDISFDAFLISVDDRIVQTNENMARLLLADSAADLIGIPALNVVHPSSVDSVRERQKQIREDGVPAPLVAIKLLRIDGSPLDVEVVATSIPYRGQRGIIVLARDITERKKFQERLRLQALFGKSNPNPVIRCSIDGAAQILNPAARTIFGIENESGVRINDLLPDVEHVDLKSCVRENRMLSYSGMIGSRYFQFQICGSADLGVAHIFGSDVTDLKESTSALKLAKERAEEADRLKDEFVSLVSHDLRSPLGSMLGLIDLLQRSPEENLTGKQVGIVSRIGKNCKVLLEMIDQLLDITRLKTGRIVPKKKFLDVQVITSVVADTYHFAAGKKDLEVLNLVPDGMTMFADERLFSEVIYNLLGNAIKFSNPGGRIWIRPSTSVKGALEVVDEGIGIDSVRIPELFSTSTKTSTLGTKGERGTGFGLPLCQDIVHAHEGSIEVHSILDQGSIFMIRLPIVSPQILLVEDDADRRSLIKNLLEDLNADVIEASDGQEALDILEERRPHLILTNLKMPNLDGMKLIERIRNREETRNIPVIVISDSEVIGLPVTAIHRGADDFVTLPLQTRDLLARVRRFLGNL